MSRKRMRATIRQRMEDYQLPLTDETKDVADVAADCALDYLLDFAVQTSETLIMAGNSSESMAVGVIINKIKVLLGE